MTDRKPDTRIRDLINLNIQSVLTDRRVALAFSGGTDSTCLLLSLLELGYSPKLYTYSLDGHESKDVSCAKLISSHLGVPLEICTIPSDIGSVLNDVRAMLRDGVRGKVAIQCMHGHYYVAPRVRERVILSGSGIDGIYGVYKTFLQDNSRDDIDKFNKRRRKHLADPNDDAMQYHIELYSRYGVKMLFPYRQDNIIDVLMALEWREINEPVWKWITVKDYWETFAMLPGYFRQRGSQQIVAGIRELHSRLLDLPVNKYHRKDVSELYRDLAQQLDL